MKTLCTLLVMLGLWAPAFAQPSAFILSSDDGEPLQLYVDGALVNEVPATQIYSGPQDPGAHRMRVVIFQGADAIEIKKSYYMDPGMVYYAAVKRNKQGEYVVRDYNMVTWDGRNPLDAENPAPQEQMMMTNPNPNTTTRTEVVAPGVRETTTTTTTTTTVNNGVSNTTVREDGDRVRMDMDVMGIKMNVDVKTSEPGMYTDNTTHTTHTTTTHVDNPAPVAAPVRRVGCPAPMSDAGFAAALQSIESKDFEDTKLSVAKQVLASNCLMSADIAKICKLFDFEATRLDFAKYAYGRTFDPENYFVVNDVFDFESSITDLTNYIASQPRR
jgi:hypothetical protein